MKVAFTDYHQSSAKKVRNKPIGKQARKAKAPVTPRIIEANLEPLPDKTIMKIENLMERIRCRRLEWGLNLSELGRLLGVDRTTVRDWETGKVIPFEANTRRITAWLDEPAPEKSDPNAWRVEFGRRIREKRRSLGMRQKALALHLGVSKNRVYCWETGKAMPHQSNLKRIAEWLDEQA